MTKEQEQRIRDEIRTSAMWIGGLVLMAGSLVYDPIDGWRWWGGLAVLVVGILLALVGFLGRPDRATDPGGGYVECFLLPDGSTGSRIVSEKPDPERDR